MLFQYLFNYEDVLVVESENMPEKGTMFVLESRWTLVPVSKRDRIADDLINYTKDMVRDQTVETPYGDLILIDVFEDGTVDENGKVKRDYDNINKEPLNNNFDID